MAEQNIVSIEDESNLQLQIDDRNTSNRFVAFLDIMGFKERVARTNHSELRKLLTDFNKDITTHIGKYQNSEIELSQFSDSIVLFSKDDNQESLKTLAEVARGIMQTAIKRHIPIKGAIAQGQLTCDMPKQLFFGQALIDAYLLEENIHYYGILVHHTAESSVLEPENDGIFKDIKAPLKCGRVSHYELLWYVDDNIPNIQEEIKAALKNIRQTVSDAPRKYIDNTLDVIKEYYNEEEVKSDLKVIQ